MRSVVLAGLVVLAGCDAGPPHQDKVENLVITDGPATAPAQDASVATAVPAPPAVIPNEKHFQALGTEPFWSVEVTPEALVYKTPENLAGTRIAYTTTKVASDTRYFGKLGGEQVILLIMPAKCSDGMSDTVYSYSATWSIGAEIRGGCARLR